MHFVRCNVVDHFSSKLAIFLLTLQAYYISQLYYEASFLALDAVSPVTQSVRAYYIYNIYIYVKCT